MGQTSLCQSDYRICESNISLEQSNEIAYFFPYWYWILRVDRNILGWVSSKAGVATLVTVLLNWLCLIKESMEPTNFFCMVIQIQTIKQLLVWHGQKFLRPILSHGTLKFFMHADVNSGKLKITLIIFGWSWSKIVMGL